MLPEDIQALRGRRLYRIVFNGRSSFEPVIGNMVLACGCPINIMFAATRDIGGTAFGQMVIQLPEDKAALVRARDFAKESGVLLEEMNNV